MVGLDVDFSVFDLVNPLVIALRPDGPIVRWNPACSKLTGYSLEEVQGKLVWDLMIPPDEIEPARRAFADLVAGHFPASFVNDLITKSGERRRIRWSNTCIVDDRGAVLFVLGTGIELSDRPSLVPYRMSDQRPHVTLRSKFPMWVFDRGTLQFLAVNDAAVGRYGYTREEFLKMTIRELRAEDELVSLQEALTHLDEGVEWVTSVTHRAKSGQKLAVEIAMTPIEFEERPAVMVLVHEARP